MQTRRPDRRLSICIISHSAYGMISGGKTGLIGGVEWQTSLFARWLVSQGHQVSLLTWDEGGPPEETIDGVRVLKVCRQDEGLPGVRFFHPKWTGLLKAMRLANAEVYYHNCGECVTGQAALWCQQHQRAFVFSLASDADCNPRLPELHSWRERYLYKLGLRRADKIVVQTKSQGERLSRFFGVQAQAIPMPCLGPVGSEFVPPDPAGRRVLWIGRVCQVKRPDKLLDLARRCRDIEFDLVGPFFEDAYSQEIKAAAEREPNIKVHGHVPKDRVGEFYRRAALLCCTSDYEGFPNTFLEAWSHGLPIVSTFDPDGLIQARDLGVASSNVEDIAEALRRLLADRAAFFAASQRARSYYEANHTVDEVLPKFVRVLREACEKKSGLGRSASGAPAEEGSGS